MPGPSAQVCWEAGAGGDGTPRINAGGVLVTGALPGPGLVCREQQGPFYSSADCCSHASWHLGMAPFPRPHRRSVRFHALCSRKEGTPGTAAFVVLRGKPEPCSQVSISLENAKAVCHLLPRSPQLSRGSPEGAWTWGPGAGTFACEGM